MTQWRTPGEQPSQAAAAQRPAPSSSRRQLQLLVLSGLFVAAAAVVVLVLLLRDNAPAGPAQGSPDAVTDTFATALRAGSVQQARSVACAPSRVLLRASHPLLGATTEASRQGAGTVQGSVAVERLALTADGKDEVGTVALRRVLGRWCVQGLALAPAAGTG